MAAGNGRLKARSNEEVFSIWFMPRGEIADELSTMIMKLSREHSTPVFKPHVTLIGGINLPSAAAIARADELAAQIKPFDVTLSRLEHRDHYFRSVFIKAKKTGPLMEANSVARAFYGQKDNEEYLPHLSLLYGNLDSQTRQRVIQNLGSVMNITFRASEIFLYYTGGEPASWYCLSRSRCGRGNQ